MAEPRSSSCAALAVAHDEPLLGTASVVRSWLLLEQPGPWGADALRQSDLPHDIADTLHHGSTTHDVRVLLLRRPQARAARFAIGEEPPTEDVADVESRECFVARSGPGRPWMEERRLAAARDVLTVDLAALAAGRRAGLGTSRSEPLYLVCTNSRHDPCCGRLGRPTALALAAVAGDAVWECSHIGGERFAANLVCLPHGLYFGRVEPDDAPRVAAAYERGEIELEHYRGRAGDPFVVQAAEVFVRERHGMRGIDDLRHVGHRALGDETVEVVFAAPGGSRFEAQVRRTADPTPRLLTCRAGQPGRPWTYSLLALHPG